MSIVRRRVTIAAGANADVNLSPFDRFGQRGGSVVVRATCAVADAGLVQMTMFVGSDLIVNQGEVPTERGVGLGPTDETPPVLGFGAPADPITINIQSLTGASGAGTIVQADITNA